MRILFRFLLMAILFSLPSPLLEAKPAKQLDLADTVAANPILTKFAAIMQASDLITFLSSKGPFTLFVPTDSAFSRLPPGRFEELLRPENKERLQHILLYHVVNGKRLSAKDLLKMTSLLSCEGTPLTIKTSKAGAQYVQKARIIHGDIRCQNGVIHQIDMVLMPPDSALPPLAPPPPPGAAPTVPSTNAPSTNSVLGAVPAPPSATQTGVATSPTAAPVALPVTTAAKTP